MHPDILTSDAPESPGAKAAASAASAKVYWTTNDEIKFLDEASLSMKALLNLRAFYLTRDWNQVGMRVNLETVIEKIDKLLATARRRR